jgi:hypothetical protein
LPATAVQNPATGAFKSPDLIKRLLGGVIQIALFATVERYVNAHLHREGEAYSMGAERITQVRTHIGRTE